MRSLEIESEITAVSENGTVSFFADGKNGVLRLPEVGSPRRAVQLLSSFMTFRSALRLLHSLCDSQGMGMSVEVAGRTVMRLGDRSHAGPFSRVMGVHPVELKMVPLLATIIGAKHLRK